MTTAAKAYRSVPVDPALRPFVQDIRVEEPSDKADEPRPYTVLPGPWPVLGLRLAGTLRVLRDGASELFSSSGITGLQDGARRYQAGPRTRSALVIVRPDAAAAVFGMRMDELANRETALAHLLPDPMVREVEERVAAATNLQELGSAIGSLLHGARARSRIRPHPGISAAVKHVLESRGNARVEALAHELGVGRRQLERLFRFHVGISPKRLAQLARFSWAAAQIGSGRPWSELALAAGYADQAHFVRSFTAFAGVPPTRFVASGETSGMSHSFNT